jgi:hypothetical protein
MSVSDYDGSEPPPRRVSLWDAHWVARVLLIAWTLLMLAAVTWVLVAAGSGLTLGTGMWVCAAFGLVLILWACALRPSITLTHRPEEHP